MEEKLMKFSLLDGQAFPKEGAVALFALLDFFQLLDDFFGSAGTQLAAHVNITYLQPFNTYTQRQTDQIKTSSQKTFFKAR